MSKQKQESDSESQPNEANHLGQLTSCVHCICAGLGTNVVARRLLGLCPLLAVSTSVLKALAISILLFLVSLLSTSLGSLLRATIYWRFKPIYFAVLASVSTMIVVNVSGIFFPLLIDSLGIYGLLLAANCLVIAQLQQVAEHAPLTTVVSRVAHDGWWTVVFVSLIASIREFGTHQLLFHDLSILKNLPVVREETIWLPFFAEPAGALITLAFVLGLINWYQGLQESEGNYENDGLHAQRERVQETLSG